MNIADSAARQGVIRSRMPAASAAPAATSGTGLDRLFDMGATFLERMMDPTRFAAPAPTPAATTATLAPPETEISSVHSTPTKKRLRQIDDCIFETVSADDATAICDASPRDGRSDAAGRPRDQDNLAGEPFCHDVFARQSDELFI